MPMYSYRCPECGRRFDELLTIEHKDEALCPHCGAKAEREWMGKVNSYTGKTAASVCERQAECGARCACPHSGLCNID